MVLRYIYGVWPGAAAPGGISTWRPPPLCPPRRGRYTWAAMCELLGMNCNVPTDIRFSFSGLIQRGGRTGAHRDGWGIAFYEGRGCRTFHDPVPGSQSEDFFRLAGHVEISN